jgi:hypothetical protein
MAGHFIPFTVAFMVRGGKRRRCIISITNEAFPSGYTGRVIAMDV